MDQPDGQVPAPRRAGGSRPDAPRVADLSALLADIDALRTTLSTDLTLAAAALDAGVDDLAAELVTGDLRAVRAFEAQSLSHLAFLGDPVAAVVPVAAVAPVVPLRRRWLVPAAPLVAAAAAAVALFAGIVPSTAQAPAATAGTDDLSQASYSLAMLSELASRGADSAALGAAARDFNDDLADLVAEADGDPLATRQALKLLLDAAAVLTEQGQAGPLRDVLARTRELEAELRRLLPRVPGGLPAVPSALRPVRPAPVDLERAAEQPAPQESRAAAPQPTTAPAPATTPAPSPSPTTPAKAPEPTSPTAEEPADPTAEPTLIPAPASVLALACQKLKH